jgi:hypothetical protein
MGSCVNGKDRAFRLVFAGAQTVHVDATTLTTSLPGWLSNIDLD